MKERARRSLWMLLGACVFVTTSVLIFVGYLTPDMLVYFLSFRWCF